MASRAPSDQFIFDSHVYTDIHPYYNIPHLFSAIDNIRECLVVIKNGIWIAMRIHTKFQKMGLYYIF